MILYQGPHKNLVLHFDQYFITLSYLYSGSDEAALLYFADYQEYNRKFIKL